MKPYYENDGIVIYHEDCRDSLSRCGYFAAVITDPPYGETSLSWDSWVTDWPTYLIGQTRQLWCWGSMRMFLDRKDDFRAWKFAQEIIWEKHNGSGFANDRFRRVHEIVTHWYQGEWSTLTITAQTTPDATARTVRRKERPAQWTGARGPSDYLSSDGGPRLMRSVLFAPSEHGHAHHPTQKPLAVLLPLIEYSTGLNDCVLDPFMGSGSTLVAARMCGREAIGYEVDERYCEIAAKRLEQGFFDLCAPPVGTQE